MKKLKLLAKKVVDERSTIQKFFLDALNQVQNEIKNAREDYLTKSKQHYNAAMAAAVTGKGTLPRVKTFTKSQFSTNCVDNDLHAVRGLLGVHVSGLIIFGLKQLWHIMIFHILYIKH